MLMTDPRRPPDTRKCRLLLLVGLVGHLLIVSMSHQPLMTAHQLLSHGKSLPAANYSDKHCCPLADDASGTPSFAARGLGPRGAHSLGHSSCKPTYPWGTLDSRPDRVAPSIRTRGKRL
ncbi:hypothetical protein TIFTF001_034965 [Ficus carica]|uniref:Uncharacterized protein n=1 Tax=Ficus carica TaxID=3494 RepID=A0AA88E4P4_FICCA|nr:hypothetical protein TIFTF001_034965 [Ficus carica]